MKALAAGPHVFDFSFPRKDTILKVEVWEDSVTIRATRDTFSAQRKAAFVRELISEGFIREHYHFGPVADSGMPRRPVLWIVDSPWRKLDEAMAARTRRNALRITVPIGIMLAFIIGLASGSAQRSRLRPDEHIGPRGQRYVSV